MVAEWGGEGGSVGVASQAAVTSKGGKDWINGCGDRMGRKWYVWGCVGGERKRTELIPGKTLAHTHTHIEMGIPIFQWESRGNGNGNGCHIVWG